MKVLNLCCSNGHGFEGWFASDDDFMAQNGGGLLQCPLCADSVIKRMPSAPRLNLSGARESLSGGRESAASGQLTTGQSASGEPPASASANAPTDLQVAELQALWMKAMRHVLTTTENVGDRFTEEARRIHYGEAPQRGIRGQANAEQYDALLEEGIEVIALPLPRALDEPLQ